MKKLKKIKNIQKNDILSINLENFKNSFLRELPDEPDNKDFIKIVKDIEKIIRASLEYKILIQYLRQELDLSKCSFFSNINTNDPSFKKVKIEFHHYPFTLYDIVEIVLLKEVNENNHNIIDTFQIANKVIKLHYQGKIGLVPLSKTVHELAHAGKLFISLNQIFGRIDYFIKEYINYISDDHLQKLKTIIELSNNSEGEKISKESLSIQISKIIIEDREKPNKILLKLEKK